MKRLLITGGSGELGAPLSELAARAWTTTSTYFRNPSVGGGQAVRLDLRDREATLALVKDRRPDAIIHTAVSDRSENMVAANRAAARHIGAAARQIGCRLIALSTDMVFDGRHPPYAEEAPPTPLGPYGQVKAENERLFADIPGCLTVRTSLIYDTKPGNRQIGWMLKKIEAQEPVPLFTDEIRQPIWVWNLAEALLELAEGTAEGIVNVAGGQATSRWEYGCALLSALGFDPEETARPVLAAEVAPNRPRDCTLRLDKARSLLKTPLLTVNEALRRAQGKADQGHSTSTTTRR
jgi:dTDP-4-dehydrorhamnose reductase